MSTRPANALSAGKVMTRRGFFASAAAVTGAAALAAPARSFAGDEPVRRFIANSCCFIRLADGRRLAYADFGDPDGRQFVIHHHGVPSCRLEIDVYRDALMCRPGVRLFVLDRPGIGRSDPNCNLSFLTWPADVVAFADAVGLARFGVMGASGGTPYALATARALPDRVTVVSLAAPIAPLEAVREGSGARGVQIAQQHARVARIALARQAAIVQRRPHRIRLADLSLPPADREVTADRQQSASRARGMAETFRQGADQVAQDAARLACPWAHWLGDVHTKVYILQGCADTVTAPAMARYLAGALPNVEATFVPGEGHFSIQRRYAATMLDAALKAG